MGGDRLESTTRLEISDKQLKEMDEQVKSAGLQLASVYAACKSNKHIYDNQRADRMMAEGLENTVGEVVAGICTLLEERHGRGARKHGGRSGGRHLYAIGGASRQWVAAPFASTWRRWACHKTRCELELEISRWLWCRGG